jgi:pimeloyl-ACP methyl ester carboxylesterase
MSSSERPAAWVSRWLSILLASHYLLGGHARAASGVDSTLDVYAAPQELIRLPDGRRMNLLCRGTGNPVVILEAGAGGSTLDWRRVQPGTAKIARTCAYDRAGMGFSDPGANPRTAESVLQDFVALMQAARIGPPYILVAHSLGSYFVRLYADHYPANVAGMVLVDPSVEYQDARFIAAVPSFAEILRKDDEMARACLRQAEAGTLTATSALFKDCTYGYSRDPAFSDALYEVQIKRRLSVSFRATLLSETHEMDGTDSEQLAAGRRSYRDMPLIILTQAPEQADAYPDLTAAQVSVLNALWNHMHDELAALSSRGANRQVPNSGHYIQRDRPEVVMETIREVLIAARRRPQ